MSERILPTMVWTIASILDHPSVYMGGPSRGSIGKAEAILKALREPTEEMLDAGALTDSRVLAGEIWQAMIDAAASEARRGT